MIDAPSWTAFTGTDRLITAPLNEVALAVKRALAARPDAVILIYDDRTGRAIDLDLRGAEADINARYGAQPVALPVAEPEPRGRGRPRLGVVAREVTLLPRHWDWLATQQGGASVALRRLVEEARGKGGNRQRRRAAQDAAYHFMSAMAGDLPGFEEAIRALYADDRATMVARMAGWPADIRDHAMKLADVGA
ncbi:MAG: DUF2239 family protein [Rhodospirillaceae bacterium]|nr:DUF2239 family protein [Rhodospirillaceae bacterium]